MTIASISCYNQGMHLRPILISLIIICCFRGECLGGDGLFSPEPYFEDAISQYKDGNLIDALERFRFLSDNRLDINNPEIAGPSLFMTEHIMEELGLDGATS